MSKKKIFSEKFFSFYFIYCKKSSLGFSYLSFALILYIIFGRKKEFLVFPSHMYFIPVANP